MSRVYRHVCDGVESALALPAPHGAAAHRLLLVRLPDPAPDDVNLSIGGGADPTAASAHLVDTLAGGLSWIVTRDFWFANGGFCASRFTTSDDGNAGTGPTAQSWGGGIADWTLTCVSAFDGTTPHAYPAGTIVEMWDA